MAAHKPIMGFVFNVYIHYSVPEWIMSCRVVSLQISNSVQERVLTCV